MILDAEIALGIDLGELVQIDRARHCRDRLALEIVDRFDVRGLLGRKARRAEEMRVGEGNLLLAIRIVCRRRTVQVERTVHHQRDAVRRGHRDVIDRDVGHAELLLYGVDDLEADIHGEADRLLVAIEIAEGHRGFLIAQRDLFGFLDLLKRAREIFGGRCAGKTSDSQENGG